MALQLYVASDEDVNVMMLPLEEYVLVVHGEPNALINFIFILQHICVLLYSILYYIRSWFPTGWSWILAGGPWENTTK